MSPTILDLFILSLIDRGLKSKYELQRKGGVSLGSSSPAIKRLQTLKLIVQIVSGGPGKRPRHELELSPGGRRLVHRGWQKLLIEMHNADLQSALRLVDMANHYGGKRSEIDEFLRNNASNRATTSKLPSAVQRREGHGLNIIGMENKWNSIRLRTEARFLRELAGSSDSPTRATKPRLAKQSPNQR